MPTYQDNRRRNEQNQPGYPNTGGAGGSAGGNPSGGTVGGNREFYGLPEDEPGIPEHLGSGGGGGGGQDGGGYLPSESISTGGYDTGYGGGVGFANEEDNPANDVYQFPDDAPQYEQEGAYGPGEFYLDDGAGNMYGDYMDPSQAQDTTGPIELGDGGQGEDTVGNDVGGEDEPYSRDNADDFINDWLNSMDDQSFDPEAELLQEQLDANLRRMSELMAGRGMSQSGAMGMMAGDIMRGHSRDLAQAYQDWMQQQVENKRDAASLLFQDSWKNMDQEHQEAMARLMFELEQRRKFGEDWQDSGNFGEAELQLMRDLMTSDQLSDQGKAMLNAMLTEMYGEDWMGEVGSGAFGEQLDEDMNWWFGKYGGGLKGDVGEFDRNWENYKNRYKDSQGWTDEEEKQAYDEFKRRWDAHFAE